MFAARGGHKTVAEKLLESGAASSFIAFNGATLLDLANLSKKPKVMIQYFKLQL